MSDNESIHLIPLGGMGKSEKYTGNSLSGYHCCH